jgi:hypothetical protein
VNSRMVVSSPRFAPLWGAIIETPDVGSSSFTGTGTPRNSIVAACRNAGLAGRRGKATVKALAEQAPCNEGEQSRQKRPGYWHRACDPRIFTTAAVFSGSRRQFRGSSRGILEPNPRLPRALDMAFILTLPSARPRSQGESVLRMPLVGGRTETGLSGHRNDCHHSLPVRRASSTADHTSFSPKAAPVSIFRRGNGVACL